MTNHPETFETHRPALLTHAYRMLGDMARAEDLVQDAWVRWETRKVDVDAPKAFLLTTITHLCLDELNSARARREESRSDRLPEPVDLKVSGIDHVERVDQLSMAFLVVLQRLTPAERAAFLLHDVFDMSHGEIAALLGKNEAACRQLLSRARENIADERRARPTPPEEHRRLLMAFVQAATCGDQDRLVELLAEDAVFIADAGRNGQRIGRARSVGRPVVGRTKILSVVRVFGRQDVSSRAALHERTLNGEPAVVAFRDGRVVNAILVSVEDGKIQRVFLQLDPERLRYVGPQN